MPERNRGRRDISDAFLRLEHASRPCHAPESPDLEEDVRSLPVDDVYDL